MIVREYLDKDYNMPLVRYFKWAAKAPDDEKIRDIEPTHGPNRVGDIPHSLASIDKARRLLGYDPQFSMREGLREAVKWYWENL